MIQKSKSVIPYPGPRAKEPAVVSEKGKTVLGFLMRAQEAARTGFELRLSSHADWMLIAFLLKNEARGQATVAKHITDEVGCSAGTVRTMLKNFSDKGYITQQQKVGRSELYQPTDKLKAFVSRWGEEIWEHLPTPSQRA